MGAGGAGLGLRRALAWLGSEPRNLWPLCCAAAPHATPLLSPLAAKCNCRPLPSHGLQDASVGGARHRGQQLSVDRAQHAGRCVCGLVPCAALCCLHAVGAPSGTGSRQARSSRRVPCRVCLTTHPAPHLAHTCPMQTGACAAYTRAILLPWPTTASPWLWVLQAMRWTLHAGAAFQASPCSCRALDVAADAGAASACCCTCMVACGPPPAPNVAGPARATSPCPGPVLGIRALAWGAANHGREGTGGRRSSAVRHGRYNAA